MTEEKKKEKWEISSRNLIIGLLVFIILLVLAFYSGYDMHLWKEILFRKGKVEQKKAGKESMRPKIPYGRFLVVDTSYPITRITSSHTNVEKCFRLRFSVKDAFGSVESMHEVRKLIDKALSEIRDLSEEKYERIETEVISRLGLDGSTYVLSIGPLTREECNKLEALLAKVSFPNGSIKGIRAFIKLGNVPFVPIKCRDGWMLKCTHPNAIVVVDYVDLNWNSRITKSMIERYVKESIRKFDLLRSKNAAEDAVSLHDENSKLNSGLNKLLNKLGFKRRFFKKSRLRPSAQDIVREVKEAKEK